MTKKVVHRWEINRLNPNTCKEEKNAIFSITVLCISHYRKLPRKIRKNSSHKNNFYCCKLIVCIWKVRKNPASFIIFFAECKTSRSSFLPVGSFVRSFTRSVAHSHNTERDGKKASKRGKSSRSVKWVIENRINSPRIFIARIVFPAPGWMEWIMGAINSTVIGLSDQLERSERKRGFKRVSFLRLKGSSFFSFTTIRSEEEEGGEKGTPMAIACSSSFFSRSTTINIPSSPNSPPRPRKGGGWGGNSTVHKF